MLSDEPIDGASLLVPAALFQAAVFGLRAVVQAARRRYSTLSFSQNAALLPQPHLVGITGFRARPTLRLAVGQCLLSTWLSTKTDGFNPSAAVG